MKHIRFDQSEWETTIPFLVGGIRLPRFKMTRDLAMFILGGAAFSYETLVGTDRPNVLYGALALMGVAAYLRGMNEMDKKK